MCVWQIFEDKRGCRSWETSCDRSVDSEVSPITSGYKFCPFCSEEIEFRPTKYAPDVASAPSAEPDSGLESVPAVESDTQPRG